MTARLLAHAEQARTKVIAAGDPGQLGSIEAGGWLAALTRQHAGSSANAQNATENATTTRPHNPIALQTEPATDCARP